MLRRAVLMLIFGAGLPILALSYMAIGSISAEQSEERRKAEGLAQGGAKFLVDQLEHELHHVEQSLVNNVRDALRTGSDTDEERQPGQAPLNAAGKALVASLENLRASEFLGQGFILHGNRLVHPWVVRAPSPHEPDQTDHDAVIDAMKRAGEETDLVKADRILEYTVVRDSGLKTEIRMEQAKIAARHGFADSAMSTLRGVLESPDAFGLDQEPVYPIAAVRYAGLAEQAGERETAITALLDLATLVAENHWNEREPDKRREHFGAIVGEAARLVEGAPGLSEQRRRLRHVEQLFAFFSDLDEVLAQLRGHPKPPQAGELAGPPFRLAMNFETGRAVADGARLVSAIAFTGSVTVDTAPVTTGRPAHRPEPRFVVGFDVDFGKLRRFVDITIAAVSSQTESSTLVAVRDPSDRLFAGTDRLEAGKEIFSVPLSKDLPGWKVLAAPSDPEAPKRAAAQKLKISLALVATCALAALASFAFALRAASREIEVAKVRTDLVRNVSHELRTPVASVQMLAEMLEEGGLDQAKQQEYVVRIARESRRLARMIENVLDLARIERGARTVETVPLSLRETVETAISVFKDGEQGRAADVRFEDSSNGALVPLDAAAIEQVLANLLSNAVKYSPPGTPIDVGCSVTATEGRISVRDHGRGMTPEERDRLFNPFYRARPEDAQATGVGLGLVITRELVRLHRGELEVASAPGQGTTFTIVLPRETS